MFSITKQEALSIASLLSCASKDKFQPAFDRVWLRFDPATKLITAFATDKFVMAQVEFEAQITEAELPGEAVFYGLDKLAIAQLKTFTKDKATTFIEFSLEGFANLSSRYLANGWLASDTSKPSTTDMVFTLIANMQNKLATSQASGEATAKISLDRLAQLTKLVAPAEKANDVFDMQLIPTTDNKPMPIMLTKSGITAFIQPMLQKA